MIGAILVLCGIISILDWLSKKWPFNVSFSKRKKSDAYIFSKDVLEELGYNYYDYIKTDSNLICILKVRRKLTDLREYYRSFTEMSDYVNLECVKADLQENIEKEERYLNFLASK